MSNDYLDKAIFKKQSNRVYEEKKTIPLNYIKKAKIYIKEISKNDKKVKGADENITKENYEKKLKELIHRTKSTIVIKGICKEKCNAVEAKLTIQKKIF